MAQQEVARGHSMAAAAEEEDDVVLERVAMESIQDYGSPCANNKHVPQHP